MSKMKKVEIIVESIYINRLVDLLRKSDITGYTIIRDIQGAGVHGIKTADDVSDVLSNNYLFTVCDEEKYQAMEYSIKAFMKKYHGKCFVSDVTVLM